MSLAKRCDGEIINGDTLQMYEGLPIATNKITETERQGIPHHLLGSLGLDQKPWTVQQFVKVADKTIGEIRSRGKLPIVFDGSQYYVHSQII